MRGLSACSPGKRGKCRNSHFFTRSHGQVSGHSRINYPIYKSLCFFFFFLHQAENTKRPRFKTSSTIRIILIFHLKNTSKRRTEKILERHGKKVFDSSEMFVQSPSLILFQKLLRKFGGTETQLKPRTI